MDYIINWNDIKKIYPDTPREKTVHTMVIGESGNRWFIPINVDDQAAWIHVENVSMKDSDGYGGSTLSFVLENGDVEEVRGPWHSNSESLYKDTGIDIRDMHYTFGVVAKESKKIEGKGNDPFFDRVAIDVLHVDEEWVCGSFDRIETIAQELADDLGQTLVYWSFSHAGAATGPVYTTDDLYPEGDDDGS